MHHSWSPSRWIQSSGDIFLCTVLLYLCEVNVKQTILSRVCNTSRLFLFTFISVLLYNRAPSSAFLLFTCSPLFSTSQPLHWNPHLKAEAAIAFNDFPLICVFTMFRWTLRSEVTLVQDSAEFRTGISGIWPSLWSSGQSSWLHNGAVLCFLCGTNWIYIWYVEESRPPLWSRGKSSWLHNGAVLCFMCVTICINFGLGD
jgi:hypothetical protein